MISWIQRYFQRHFRLVFILVLIAVALPMVVIYSTSSGGQGGATIQALERPFFNVNLDNPEQVRRITLDGQLSVFLRAGYPALQGAQLQQYTFQRVAGLALADELHLPMPSASEVEKHVLTLRAFQNEQGNFDQGAYTRFADSLKTGGGATIADVNRVLRDDVRLAEVTKLVGGPGYLLPADVKSQLSRVDSTWTVQVASLDYASFSPALNPTEDALKRFHDENAFRYEVPARPRVSVIEIKAADFVPANAPTEEELRAFYNANIASFPVPADAATDAVAPAGPVDNFPKVRAQVENALRTAASRRLASEAANRLTVAIYERKLAPNSVQLADFLAGQGRAPVAIAPFAPNQPPADRPWLANYGAALARLNAERYFSDPIATPDGYAILIWNESLPAYAPVFAEVRDRVTADYREIEKRRLFIERGNTLRGELQAAATTPNGFAEKAAAAKLEVKTFTNFSMNQPPADLPPGARDALLATAAGNVSSLIPGADKGYFVFVQERKEPNLSTDNPRYAEVQTQYGAMAASYSENATLGELIEAELKKTAATP
jgi:peptidyl-prolyl cis-trans isomerase D